MPAVHYKERAIYTLMEPKTDKEDMNSKDWNSIAKKSKECFVSFLLQSVRNHGVSGFVKFPPFWLLSDTGFLAPLLGTGAGTAAQALPSSTWFQHALSQRLSVEGVRGGVQQVPQDDGAVHDGAGGQSHGVSHQGVH